MKIGSFFQFVRRNKSGFDPEKVVEKGKTQFYGLAQTINSRGGRLWNGNDWNRYTSKTQQLFLTSFAMTACKMSTSMQASFKTTLATLLQDRTWTTIFCSLSTDSGKRFPSSANVVKTRWQSSRHRIPAKLKEINININRIFQIGGDSF